MRFSFSVPIDSNGRKILPIALLNKDKYDLLYTPFKQGAFKIGTVHLVFIDERRWNCEVDFGDNPSAAFVQDALDSGISPVYSKEEGSPDYVLEYFALKGMAGE